MGSQFQRSGLADQGMNARALTQQRDTKNSSNSSKPHLGRLSLRSSERNSSKFSLATELMFHPPSLYR